MIFIKDIRARGLGFDFRPGPIGHDAAEGSSPLRCFCDLAQALTAEMGSALVRYALA